MKKNSLKNENKKKERAKPPFTVDCYNERLNSFSIFLMFCFLFVLSKP
jgi:hypothetical protein